MNLNVPRMYPGPGRHKSSCSVERATQACARMERSRSLSSSRWVSRTASPLSARQGRQSKIRKSVGVYSCLTVCWHSFSAVAFCNLVSTKRIYGGAASLTDFLCACDFTSAGSCPAIAASFTPSWGGDNCMSQTAAQIDTRFSNTLSQHAKAGNGTEAGCKHHSRAEA